MSLASMHLVPGEVRVSFLSILVLARIIHVCPCMFALPSPLGRNTPLFTSDSLYATQTPVNGLDLIFSLFLFPTYEYSQATVILVPLSGTLRPSPTFSHLLTDLRRLLRGAWHTIHLATAGLPDLEPLTANHSVGPGILFFLS